MKFNKEKEVMERLTIIRDFESLLAPREVERAPSKNGELTESNRKAGVVERSGGRLRERCS